ncbi:hypothetical protein [Gimesia fumaroli]|uniref:Uncharacterized protein n=1 Tax=Gimesia fumaroli TaxID=2527976 RepID=A0A518I600_9PLAN|nr:hypothetical protein [Gimesia fumaroli]QDV48513.1 hypothetical protein Enr17x_05250 [Gimesia fumaroli]
MKRIHVPVSNRLLICLLLLAFALCLKTTARGAEQQQSETPESAQRTKTKNKILKIWKQRQQETDSLIATWDIMREAPDNFWSTYQADYSIPATEKPQASPKLYILDEKVRFESPRWHKFAQLEFTGYSTVAHKGLSGATNSKAYKFARESHFDDSCPQLKSSHHLISLFDGNNQTDFFQPFQTGIAFVRLTDRNHAEKGRHPWVEQSIYRPLLLTYRPFGLLKQKRNADSFRLLETASLIESRNCVVMEYPGPNGLQGRCFIDLERDATILRNLLLRDDKIMEQIDIQYQKNSSGKWIPEQWTVILKSHFEDFPGRPQTIQYVSCHLPEIAINAPVSPDLFQINYPPGTYLFDEPQHKSSVILAENQSRPLKFHEIAQLDLMQKYPSPHDSKNQNRPPISIIAILATTFVIVLIFRKRFSRRAVFSPGQIQEQLDESDTQSS